MSRVVGVHGVGNYLYFAREGEGAAEAIGADWSGWLGEPVSVAYYSEFLHRGTAQGSPEVALEPLAQEAFLAWVDALRPVPQVAQGPRTARVRQAAEWATRKFGKKVTAAVAILCREVQTYLAAPDSPRRIRARDRVCAVLREERPEVVVAHSLGSVVTYEALWASRQEVDLLVTVGSPLAMRPVVLDRLVPGTPARPPGVRRWVNVADVGDIVAIPRGGLAPHFDGVHADEDVTIGDWDFHTAKAYLATPCVRKLVSG